MLMIPFCDPAIDWTAIFIIYLTSSEIFIWTEFVNRLFQIIEGGRIGRIAAPGIDLRDLMDGR